MTSIIFIGSNKEFINRIIKYVAKVGYQPAMPGNYNKQQFRKQLGLSTLVSLL